MRNPLLFDPEERVRHDKVQGMSSPVECKCGAIYDLTTVTVQGRYADCDTFTTPCCKRSADTRQWKSLPDYTPLRRDGTYR